MNVFKLHCSAQFCVSFAYAHLVLFYFWIRMQIFLKVRISDYYNIYEVIFLFHPMLQMKKQDLQVNKAENRLQNLKNESLTIFLLP